MALTGNITIEDDGRLSLELVDGDRSATITSTPSEWRSLIAHLQERLPIDLIPSASIPGCLQAKVASILVEDLVEGDQFRFTPDHPWETISRLYRVDDVLQAETVQGAAYTLPALNAVQVNLVGRSCLLATQRARTTREAIAALELPDGDELDAMDAHVAARAATPGTEEYERDHEGERGVTAQPWTRLPFLSIDTETTGVDVFTDRIVEAAAVLVDADGDATYTWHRIINAGVDIPDEAAAIHGISNERMRDEGVAPAVALDELAKLIVATSTCPVVIYNAGFDWPLLIVEAERHGVDFPAFRPIVDPFLIDKMVDRYRKGSRKLTAVAEHYGVELGDKAHGAVADATASAQVMRALLAAHPEVGTHSLADMWIRQVRGHETWRQGFVEYRRQTEPAFDIAPGWPIPAGAAA